MPKTISETKAMKEEELEAKFINPDPSDANASITIITFDRLLSFLP